MFRGSRTKGCNGDTACRAKPTTERDGGMAVDKGRNVSIRGNDRVVVSVGASISGDDSRGGKTVAATVVLSATPPAACLARSGVAVGRCRNCHCRPLPLLYCRAWPANSVMDGSTTIETTSK